MANEFFIPNLPALPNAGGGGNAYHPDFEGVIGMLRSSGDVPGLTNTLVPEVRKILSGQGEFLMPQIDAIRARGEDLAAGVQSDMGARGIRGSDIEASGMLGARLGALGEERGLRGQFGMQGSQTLIDVLTKAMSGDADAARNLRVMLSQAMGQELGSIRDMEMFRQEQANAREMASGANKAALWGAGIGAIGQMGGSALRAGIPMMSDPRLKTDVKVLGEHEGMAVVSWEWNDEAKKMGAPKGRSVGVMADQAALKNPKSVGVHKGYLTVDYSKMPKGVKSAIKKYAKGA